MSRKEIFREWVTLAKAMRSCGCFRGKRAMVRWYGVGRERVGEYKN